MNIFYTDSNPQTAAQNQCDKHVVKMCLETAQILHSPFHEHGVENTPYRKAHFNHPSVVWARQSSAHWQWLVQHGEHLCLEYQHRYGKEHACAEVIWWLKENIRPEFFPTEEWLSEPPRSFGEFTSDKQSNVEAYKDYYRYKRPQMSMFWTNRNPPEWL